MAYNDINLNVNATGNLNVQQSYKTEVLKPNVVGEKNVLTQAMISSLNTKYVIKWDYVLGENITVPEGCLIELDGGSISNKSGYNYKIIGQDTTVVHFLPLDEVMIGNVMDGTWRHGRDVTADEETITEINGELSVKDDSLDKSKLIPGIVDNEDIHFNDEGALQLKDRSTKDGMGKVILRKNIVTFGWQPTVDSEGCAAEGRYYGKSILKADSPTFYEDGVRANLTVNGVVNPQEGYLLTITKYKNGAPIANFGIGQGFFGVNIAERAPSVFNNSYIPLIEEENYDFMIIAVEKSSGEFTEEDTISFEIESIEENSVIQDYLTFDGFVENVSIEEVGLASTPDAIYYDTVNHRFVAKKTNVIMPKYYITWQDGEGYTEAEDGDVFKDTNEDKYYAYSSEGLTELAYSKNILTQDMLTQSNTIYVIRYDFDLSGESITIPENCVLQFDGGSLSNGTIIGRNSIIDSDIYTPIFGSIILQGTFKNTSLSVYLWGVSTGSEASAENSTIINTYIVPSLENILVSLLVPLGDFYYDTPIVLSGKYNVNCQGTLHYSGDNTATALTIGNSEESFNKKFHIKLVSENNQEDYYDPTDESRVVPESYGLKMVNIYTSEIWLDIVRNFAYDVTLVADGAGFVYNAINIGDIGSKSYIILSLKGINGGWCSENLFIGGRFQGSSSSPFVDEYIAVRIEGNSTHQSGSNVFIKPCVEGSHIGFDFKDYAYNNIVEYPRCEKCDILAVFSPEHCYRNSILKTQQGNSAPITNNLINDNIVWNFNNLVNKVASVLISDDIVMRYNSTGVYNSNLIGFDPKRGFGPNITNERFAVGHIIDTSTFKSWSFEQDISGRFIVALVNQNNEWVNISDITNITDDLMWRLVTQSAGDHIIYKDDIIRATINFKSNVDRVFVGVVCSSDSNPSAFKVFAQQYDVSEPPTKGLLKELYDTRLVPAVPTENINIPYGYKLLVGDSGSITFDGETWIKDASRIKTRYLLDETTVMRYRNSDAFIMSNLQILDNDGAVSFPAASKVGIGYVLDTSEFKEFSMSFEGNTAGRFIIVELDDNNQKVLSETPQITDILDYNNCNLSYDSTSGVFISGSPTKYNCDIKVKSTVNRIFLGVNVYLKNVRLDAYYYDIPEDGAKLPSNALILQPYDTKKVASIPIDGYNIPTGHHLLYTPTNTGIEWDGESWRDSDGAAAGVLRNGTSDNRPSSSGIYVGFKYYDTDLNTPIYWNGTTWVDEKGFTPDIHKGTTTQRPVARHTEGSVDEPVIVGTLVSSRDIGYDYFDTDLGKMIYAKVINNSLGSIVWVDAAGATV